MLSHGEDDNFMCKFTFHANMLPLILFPVAMSSLADQLMLVIMLNSGNASLAFTMESIISTSLALYKI